VITYALDVTPGNGPPSTAILFADIESLSQKERMKTNGGEDGEPLRRSEYGLWSEAGQGDKLYYHNGTTK
jgi:hypothetical protein